MSATRAQTILSPNRGKEKGSEAAGRAGAGLLQELFPGRECPLVLN